MALKEQRRPLGLYLHIPFCRHKCIYCDFYSLAGREEAEARYIKALCRHLEEVAPSAANHRVDTVYIGGGTPTVLPTRLLLGLLDTVRSRYRLDREGEITLEANPESARDWRSLRALRRCGVNRLSLGVQAADDGLLKAIGRVHTWADVEAAVAAARRAGIRNLSLDLIYGLPGQSLDQWKDTLEKAAALEPEHLSCYGLKVEEGTPLAAMAGRMDLPDDDCQADMYLWTVERLEQLGYGQHEISNFARPGFDSRHNTKYWTLSEYAGFGPGAHSDFGEVRYAYSRDLEGYIRGVMDGTLRVSEREELPLRERDTEYIMLSLRLASGISRRTFEYRFRRRFAPLEAEFLRYEAMGLTRRTEQGWRLTPEGFLVSNTIIASLWEALGRDKLRRAEAAERGDFRVLP